MKSLGVADFARRIINRVPLSVRRPIKRKIPLAAKRFVAGIIVNTAPKSGVFECVDGRRFERTSDRVFARLLLEGDYEPELTRVAARLVRRGDVVVDAGANFGWYTVLFGIAVGPEGHVHSFEPIDEIHQRLVRNIALNELNGVVDACKAAVGAKSGWVTMETIDVDRQSALAYAKLSDKDAAASRLVTLDESLSSHVSNIAYIKIDIEGFEGEALIGAASLLAAANPPIIQMELNHEALERAGSSRELVLDFLRTAGYRFFEVDHKLRLVPATAHASDVFARPGRGVFSARVDELT